MREEAINLLILMYTLEQTNLLKEGSTWKASLIDQLLVANNAAVSEAQAAIEQGNVARLEGALLALANMDTFRNVLRERVPGIEINGWKCSRVARVYLSSHAATVLASLLPGGFAETRWDAHNSSLINNIFLATERLREPGKEVLSSWGTQLVDQVQRLKTDAAEVSSATAAVRTLSSLRDCRDHLDGIVEVLSPHGAAQLAHGGMETAFQDAQEALKQQLGVLSRKVVEERRGPADSTPNWEVLRQLCRSTELQELLSETDLENKFLMVPLASAFAPKQSKIDEVADVMETTPPNQWRSELEELVKCIEGMGELGPQMIEAKKLAFDKLLTAMKSEATKAKEAFVRVVESFKDVAQSSQSSTSQWRGSSAMSSVSGRMDADEDLPIEVQSDEEAVDALDKLVMLLPGDKLLRMVGPLSFGPAFMALQSSGWAVKSAVEYLLRRAKKFKERISWTCLALMDKDALTAILKLNALVMLAQKAWKHLASHVESAKNLPDSLKDAICEAEDFVRRFVSEEVNEWSKAETNVMGWPDLFDRHLQMAKSIFPLAPDDVGPEAKKLRKKVEEWQTQCRAKTDECLDCRTEDERKEMLESAVSKGMAFEESALFMRMEMQPYFRPLVEARCVSWIQAAQAAPPSSKQVHWHVLQSLRSAIERLPGFTRRNQDTRTLQLHQMVVTAIQPLERTMTDNETRFKTHVEERRFTEAWRLLRQINNVDHNEDWLQQELARSLEAAVEQLRDTLNVDGVVQAAEMLGSCVPRSVS